MKMNHLRNQSGLTLIELMLVLFILALFATLAVQTIVPKVKTAEIETTRHQMQIFAVALDTYRLDNGRYPDSLLELVESSGEKWNGPYLRPARIPKDPWGNDYLYELVGEGSSFELYSTGQGEKEIRFGAEQ